MSFLRHGKSIDPMLGWNTPGQMSQPAPALIGLDEFQLAIPWRDALQQSPPLLHQPGATCRTLGLPVQDFSANGQVSLNWLSHPRGQAQKPHSENPIVRVRSGSHSESGDFHSESAETSGTVALRCYVHGERAVWWRRATGDLVCGCCHPNPEEVRPW